MRGRLGILPVDNVLLFATDGFAYGNVRTTTTASNLPPFNCNGRYLLRDGIHIGHFARMDRWRQDRMRRRAGLPAIQPVEWVPIIGDFRPRTG